MKVALYTIFRCTNYGALLQAAALARVLRALVGDENVDVLNHFMDARDTHLMGKITNPRTPFFQRWRNRRKFAHRYFHPVLLEVRRQHTIKFIADEIRPTAQIYRTPRAFLKLPSYDVVVVGSDQIWNSTLNHDFGCNPYLCENFPAAQRRVAYAASLGSGVLPESFHAAYRAALARFAAITVREASGAQIVSSLLNQPPPPVVLDPTLLLTAQDWQACWRFVANRPPKGSYIAAYWVRTLLQEDVVSLARLARNARMPVCLMSAGPVPKLDFPSCIVPYLDAGPFDFVRTLANAQAVVTDSFHGLQFATCFKRPFLALADLSQASSNAARLTDFVARYARVQGVRDIALFRSGTPFECVDFASFDDARFEADRVYSHAQIKELLV